MSLALAATGTSDTQIIDLENKDAQDLNVNFKLQKFNSCENLENVMLDYLKDYSEIYPWYLRWAPEMLYDKWISPPSIWWQADESKSAVANDVAQDFSQTNIQVAWVDESDIIKNDGKNIYFYNSKDKKVYITQAFPADKLTTLKTIKIPDSYNNPELFINWNKLTIISTKYDNFNYSYYWFNRNTKTVVIVYDISNLEKLRLDKFYQVDWNFVKSRKIWDFIYVISSSNFSFPYPLYYRENVGLDDAKIKSDFNSSKVLPKKAELSYTTNTNSQNFVSKWRTLPYNLSYKTAGTCNEIEYILPDKNTLKNYNFVPNFVTLSIIDTKNPENTVKNKVLFWDVNDIYMSLDNLYIASHLYTPNPFRCPVWAFCILPYYQGWENTLIHKIWITNDKASYVNSTIIPWSPLNQYSMDQDSNWLFRIVTTKFSPESSINLYILDKNLKSHSKLEDIIKWENFQSSRFIWNKLYLVSFKQIDPLFVIDLKDSLNPKILWELKIPGYSTYLHPYDENHLIWIWYDTTTNRFWGTQNSWVKVDLYDISDFSNPKQKYTLTLWDNWSYSEALNNPRLFIWNAGRNTLFLPIMLYKNANDPANPYRNIDAFQWGVAIKIDKDAWIKELARISHIDTSNLEEKRQTECRAYSKENLAPPRCEKIIGWWEYCPPVSTYIPPYCYESSTAWEYLANNIWQYNNDFVLRNLYFDNNWYTVSNGKIQINSIDNFSKVNELKLN